MAIKQTKTCDHCGMTEDHHEDELGLGPLMPVKIIINPGEEGSTETGTYESNFFSHLCIDGFREWLDIQPDWLMVQFNANNSLYTTSNNRA